MEEERMNEKIRQTLKVPDDYQVMCGIAVGRPGKLDALPKELREREVPTPRKPIREISCEGPFAF